jgi:hypothetical protein
MNNPINDVPFGKEKTKGERLARAAWELEQASKIRASQKPVGWEHLVEAHERTARAYEALAREQSGHSAPKRERAAKKSKSAGTAKNPFRQKELHWDPAVRGRGQVAARSGHRAFVYPDGFGQWSWEVTSPVEETRGGITRTVHFRKQVGTANSKAQAKVAAERFLLAQLS